MQGILNFNREDPEEEKSFQRACNADVVYGVLWDFSQEVLRGYRKHGFSDKRLNDLLEGEHHEAIYEVLEIIEGKFYELLKENNIDIE
jgi:hypothetical protein